MTRGKHGAQAARRRADADNAEITRLRAEVAKWKRLANQYVEQAKRADKLENALRKARGEVGVPEYEHDRELAALETKWAERWDDAMHAVTDLLNHFMAHIDLDGNYISARFLAALHRLPSDVVRDGTEGYWTRDDFRLFMSPGMANMASTNGRQQAVKAMLAAGYPNGQIPKSVVDDPDSDYNAALRHLEAQHFYKPPGKRVEI